MSTATTNEVALKPLPASHYGFADLVRSEWTKIRTVRSTVWTVGLTIILGIGIGALVTAVTRGHWSSMNQFSRQTFDAPATSLIGLLFAQFSIGVLGAMAVTAEYSTGTIRATFSAAPNRLRVYGAKIAVFGVLALIVAEFTSFVAFFLGQFLLSAPATHATLSTPGALRAVVGGGLFICLLGLLALGLGTIIRHTAGAISAFVGILLVIPLIAQALPYQLSIDVRRYLPISIGSQIVTTNRADNGAGSLSPWMGMLVLAIEATVLLIIGGALLQRRDA
ncbi:MAG: ABC transporter permease [Acidimicrobiales bacterium]